MKQKSVLPLIILGTIVLFSFVLTDWLVREQANHANNLHSLFQQTRIHWLQLEKTLLAENAALYSDYGDSQQWIRQLQQDLAIFNNTLPEQASAQNALQRLKGDLAATEERVEHFHTQLAMIKNSTQQLPRLLSRYLTHHPHGEPSQTPHHETDRQYLAMLSRAVSEVVLAKTSGDLDLAPSLKSLIDKMHQQPPPSSMDTPFHQLFLRHLEVIYRTLPGFLLTLENIQKLPFLDHLDILLSRTEQAQRKQLAWISTLHGLLAAIFLLLLIYAGWLLIRMQKENRRLEAAREALDIAVISDTLTGLPNRLAWSQQGDDAQAVLLMNVDRFKHINDFYGSNAGDQILIQLTRLLISQLDGQLAGRLYRVGGDDFALRLPKDHPESPTELAKRLLFAIEHHDFSFEGRPVRLSVSIGISEHAPLLETADLALKSVKRKRTRIQVYQADEGLEKAVEHNLHMVDVILKALEDDCVVPWFQPLLNNHTGRVDRYECLMRIEMPDGTVLTPWQFLPVAQEARLQGQMSRALFRQALRYMNRTSAGFSLNLSMSDMEDEALVKLFSQTFSKQPALARRITIEILETEDVQDNRKVERFLQHMRDLGCTLAIDDFGSGYSNLSQLLKLGVDQLKIDASLIRNLDSSPQSLATVRAILEFARAAQVKTVVAEHVSSHQIQRIVHELGIDYSQGYWVGKPEPELLPEELLQAEKLQTE